jgi:hypothetical protein
VGTTTGTCPKAEKTVDSSNVPVNQGTAFIGKLQLQMQFMAFDRARRRACARSKSSAREEQLDS